MPGGVVSDAAGQIRAVSRDADGSGEFPEPAVKEGSVEELECAGDFREDVGG